MNSTKLIHIFKPGRHVTMAGDVIEFTEADVAATARAYNPQLHEAPMVIGHPKTDAPAHGWVQSLTATERGLFATPRDVEAAFAEQVGQRRYGKVSSKFYSPNSPSNPVPGVWYLRHVGFLGAQPPGVKGLDNPSFADAEDGCVSFQETVEFGDWDDRANANLWRSLRDWFLAKFGQEEADRALPGWNVDSLQESAAQPEKSEAVPIPAFADPVQAPAGASPAETTIQQENHAVTPEEKAALEAENAQLKKQLAERDARDKEAQAAKRHQDNAAFAEGLVSKGLLAPRHKDAVVAVLDLAAAPDADGKCAEFGDGDDKQPLVNAVKGFLGDMPKVVEVAEVATHGRAATVATGDAEFAENADPERLKQHQAIKAHMAEHKVDYATAARAVIK